MTSHHRSSSVASSPPPPCVRNLLALEGRWRKARCCWRSASSP
ncbi:hypothetical protein P4114_25175 [Pseudomonas aeruginosa]|nr:hypothetical protein [Pseudomonas aeruginosa]